MLICLTATSTPLGGRAPRTSKPVPAMTRRPQRLSSDQCRPTQAAPRGKASSGRQKIAMMAEVAANHTKNRAERNRVIAESGLRSGFVAVCMMVDGSHDEARHVFQIFIVQQMEGPRTPPCRKIHAFRLDRIGNEPHIGHQTVEEPEAAGHMIAR